MISPMAKPAMRWKPIAPTAWCMRPNLRAQARDDLVDRWDRDRQASPDQSRIILTHAPMTRCGPSTSQRGCGCVPPVIWAMKVRATVERGDRAFARRDRVMFLQNERGLGVKNGTLGTIEQVNARSMTIQADDDRSVHFDLKDYNRIGHGYAATIHKAQKGMTVDRTHVLATPGMDAHGSYVALSRHRDGIDLHYGHDDFVSPDRLTRTLWRGRSKDAMASDYEQRDPAQTYAERRGDLQLPRARCRRSYARSCRKKCATFSMACARLPTLYLARTTRGGRNGKRRKGRRRKTGKRRCVRPAPRRWSAMPGPWMRSSISRIGVTRPARRPGEKELQEARRGFEKVRPNGTHDAEAAYKKDPELAREAAGGQLNRAIRALQLETELRTDQGRRADRFVESWQKLDLTSQRQYQAGDISAYKATRSAMDDMAKSFERDPQLEIHPRQPQAGAWHRVQIGPPARPRSSPSASASTLAEARASGI